MDTKPFFGETDMTKEINLVTVRSDRIEVGKRYFVAVHFGDSRWMWAREVPSVSLGKMTQEDKFVFETCYGKKKELVLKVHEMKGPKFLIAKVPSLRGDGLVNSRVTFFEKETATVETKLPKKLAA